MSDGAPPFHIFPVIDPDVYRVPRLPSLEGLSPLSFSTI